MNKEHCLQICVLALVGTIMFGGAQTAPAAVTAQAPSTVSILPLDKSEIVTKGSNGELGVGQKNGTPIEGFKLSQHDVGIASPSIAVAPDGTIHVAFLEVHSTTGAYAIYHRSSADGGKTWTEAKNLTEDLPNMEVGRCQVLVDARNRVYVIWRAGGEIGTDLRGNRSSIWFRELEGGKWTKAKPISHMTLQPGADFRSAPDGQPISGMANGVPNYYEAAYSFFATVDATGAAQVVWNVMPDKWHSELMDSHGHSLGVGNGLVFQSTLDGATAGKPREVFMPVVSPANNQGGISCDGLDTLNGYIDSAGAAHFVALAQMPGYGHPRHSPIYEVIENGKAGQGIELPDLSFHAWSDIPTLLVDAKGKQHVIAMYLGGEHPNFRDYLIGSDDEPTVILAAPGLKGVCNGFQAYQGPGGHMAVIMQIQSGEIGDQGDSFVSMSDGTGWSKPINITNNAARKRWVTTNTGVLGSVSHGTAYHPGLGAAAFDRQGHLILAIINGKVGSFGSAVGGVVFVSGGTEQPMLFFYRF